MVAVRFICDEKNKGPAIMISVVTVTYNRAHLLGEAMRSVLDQSYTDFEYIIVDDGSEDETEKVVRSFRDSRIIYTRIDHTGKIALLRNKAMQSARGDYIAFIDSDDLWVHNKLQLQLDAMKNDDTGFSFCDAEIFTKEKIIFQSLYDRQDLPARGNYFLSLIDDVRFVLFPSSILFKASCLSKTGFLNEKHTSGDKDFLCRLAFSFKGSFVSEKLVRIRRHSENVTHDFDHVKGILEDELKTTNDFHAEKKIDKKLYERLSARFHYKLAEHFYHNGKFREAKKNYWSSLMLKPVNGKAVAKFIISIARA
jgi:glycosyltransferase involved in cell wall biosynthesis